MEEVVARTNRPAIARHISCTAPLGIAHYLVMRPMVSTSSSTLCC
jgi:hypothetical protein